VRVLRGIEAFIQFGGGPNLVLMLIQPVRSSQARLDGSWRVAPGQECQGAIPLVSLASFGAGPLKVPYEKETLGEVAETFSRPLLCIRTSRATRQTTNHMTFPRY
jgi:hypothetical protein